MGESESESESESERGIESDFDLGLEDGFVYMTMCM